MTKSSGLELAKRIRLLASSEWPNATITVGRELAYGINEMPFVAIQVGKSTASVHTFGHELWLSTIRPNGNELTLELTTRIGLPVLLEAIGKLLRDDVSVSSRGRSVLARGIQLQAVEYIEQDGRRIGI